MSKNSYSRVGGENVRLLQALIDEAPSYTKPTNSRNANILKSIINNTEYNEPPQSEIEELLIALKAKIGGEIEVNELTVTENGSYDAGLNKAYNPVNVELPLDSKEITANGTYNASDDNLAGFSQVTVNVEGYKLKDIPNTPTAIATFSDGANLPMPKLEVAVEPQQDLHGYDAPWVGGSGKNKCPVNSGSITVGDFVTFNTPLPNGTYSFSLKATRTPSSGSYASLVPYDRDGNAYSNVIGIEPEKLDGSLIKAEARELNNGLSKIYVYSIAGNWSDSRDYTLSISNLQIEEGSTATSYLPYSNICPIIGWDECNVSVVGKNLCKSTIHGYVSSTDDLIVIDNDTKSAIFYAHEGQTYTISSSATMNKSRVALVGTDNVVNYTPILQREILSDNVNTWTATWTGWTVWYKCSSRQTAFDNSVQVELGSTPTTYEPYNGQTISIDLDGTRYGGKVDLVSGVMTVEKVGINVISQTKNSWGVGTKSVCYRINVPSNSTTVAISQYHGAISNMLKEQLAYFGNSRPNELAETTFAIDTSGTILAVYDTDLTLTEEQFKTKYNDLFVVYPLATPLTIQLPTTVVKSLRGVNNISADSGDVLSGKYFAEL